jgi:putative transposase
MPRPPRAVIPGQPLHVIQRGVNRTACFVDDIDRDCYVRALRVASEGAGCAIHAYVLMSNHVHLLLTPRDAWSPSRMMHTLGRGYVRYFNDRHERTGTLWEGRFRSSLVDSERYFLACSRYVELNPVRAGMVSRADEYRWSSFRCNAHGERDALVTPHPVYMALGRIGSSRRASYRALFASPLGPEVMYAIRRAAKSGLAVGTKVGRVTLEDALRRHKPRGGRGGDRRSPTFVARGEAN